MRTWATRYVYIRRSWLTAELNPNYEGRYQSAHAPQINAGVVIKTNANQRYTSTAATTFLLRRVAAKAGVPLQEFEVRNDSVRIRLR